MKWKFISGPILTALQQWGESASWMMKTRKQTRAYLLKEHKQALAKFAVRFRDGVPVEQLVDDFAQDDLMSEIFFNYIDEIKQLEQLKIHDESVAKSKDFYLLMDAAQSLVNKGRKLRHELADTPVPQPYAKPKTRKKAAAKVDTTKDKEDKKE